MPKVLVVDDEPAVLFTLRELLEERGLRVCEHADGAAVVAQLAAGELDDIDLVLTDYAMPGLDGMALLERLRVHRPELPVVLLTARGSERLAARAIKAGAFDYLPKPFDLDEVDSVVTRALELSGLRAEARRAAAQSVLGKPFLGNAPSFRNAVDRALRIAKRDIPVLVRGETGTGKELLAALLHAGSARADKPLVRFNCAAIASELAESELFGHVRGAFTGATGSHRGFFARADRGTLVLDEIGELPLNLQPKLLRALQSGELQPVGGSSIEHVDVRVIACTHRDLLADARACRFREDLYYRLAVVELTMPPLRERAEDIPILAQLFAQGAAERFGVDALTLSADLLSALKARAFPGNVRELENLMTRLVALCEGPTLDASSLSALEGSGTATSASEPSKGTFREQVERLERSLLKDALERAGGNQSEAARALGLSRVTFLDKLKRHGLHS